MGWLKIVKHTEIDASQEQVFELLLDVKRRMQLSPTWGENKIEHIPPDYPQEGSRIRLAPAKHEDSDQSEFEVLVTEYQSGRRLSYRYEGNRPIQLTWSLHPSMQATRLTLEAEYFEAEDENVEADGEETAQEKLDRQAQEWVTNIKRYVELGEGLPQRFLKWALDGFILEMPAFQRRVLLILVAFQFVTFLTFLIAALGFAIARYLILR